MVSVAVFFSSGALDAYRVTICEENLEMSGI